MRDRSIGIDGRSGRIAWASSLRAGLSLVLLCLVCYLPGLFSIPTIDRDETRFAQASRQMVESVLLPQDERDPVLHAGGIVVPLVGGKARINKPPLVYYVQGLSVAVFTGGEPRRDAIWMYRVPGVVCAVLSVLLTWRLGLRLFDARAAVLGAALLAVCPLMVVDAHMARADQLLLVTVLATQTLLWKAWRTIGARGALPLRDGILLWAAIAIGIMAKGPITPMVCVLTAAGLAFATGRWSLLWRLRPVTGVVVIGVICGPWVYAVGSSVGWETYLSTIVDETLGRAGEAKEGHFGPPGYHTVLSAVLLWPGSLLTLAAVGRAWRRGGLWRRAARRGLGARPAERFLLAWIVPSWVVFELVLTKLPHYTMPMYPALALLSARALLVAGSLPGIRSIGMRFGVRLWGVIGMILGLGAAAVVARDLAGLPWYFGIVYVPCAMAAATLFRTLAMRRFGVDHLGLLGSGMRVAVVLSVVLFQFSLPQARSLWNTERIMVEVGRIDPSGTRRLAAAGYHEDSLVFATRGRIERIGVEQVEAWLDSRPDGLAIVPTASVSSMQGVRVLTDGWREPGYNYSNGRRVDLSIVERVRGVP
ncbi:MAG: glycosyltransferase family 39 protein [Phycisphaeraceae bacterium]|nr:MAG: glycosyltransferase family 39 protein [Phycisphaeraceae bacterium]